jgi:hypothetical protein
MEAETQCGQFRMKGSRPFGRLLSAYDKVLVRQMKPPFLVSFIAVSPVSSVVKSALIGAAPLRCAILKISRAIQSQDPPNY